MSRGPKSEQIDGGDPTFRVEVENSKGERIILDGAELLSGDRASEIARESARRLLKPNGIIRHIHVVNERTGFTRDTISFEPTRRKIESN